MVDDGAEDGANVHGVGALRQAQGKQFVPASLHQVNIIIVTAGRRSHADDGLRCSDMGSWGSFGCNDTRPGQ